MKVDVNSKDMVRVMCMFEVLYVAYVKSECSCVVYMCCEWFDGVPMRFLFPRLFTVLQVGTTALSLMYASKYGHTDVIRHFVRNI